MTKQNASDEARSHASWSARFQARECCVEVIAIAAIAAETFANTS